jgi:hypothetical protein
MAERLTVLEQQVTRDEGAERPGSALRSASRDITLDYCT